MPISPHKTLYVPKAHLTCTCPHTPGPHIKIATEEQFKESAVLPLITSSDNAFSCSPTWPCFISEPLSVPFVPEQAYRHFQCHATLGCASGFPSALQTHAGLQLCKARPPSCVAAELGPEPSKGIRGCIHFSPLEGRRWTTWSPATSSGREIPKKQLMKPT